MKKMNLFMASMLVLVNMIGTGIFLLPVSMASIGSISSIGWLIATLGAGAIGLVFALLALDRPESGGPYGYSKASFGDYSGFQTNYIYWTANVVGNIAIATTVTGYLTQFIPTLKNADLDAHVTIVILWIAVLINLKGARWVGVFTSSATLFALVPVCLMVIFGWFWFDAELFASNWNPSHQAPWNAVSASVSYALWAFMGVESASVAADSIENPKKNIPLATLIGFSLSAVLYIGTSSLLLGMFPAEQLANSSAPFADAALKMAGPIGASIMALCAIFKAFSSLVGWTLIVSESALAAAKDGLFFKIYSKPFWNLVISGILMTGIVIYTQSSSLTHEFNTIIDIAVILTVLPYLYSGAAYLKIKLASPSPIFQKFGVLSLMSVVTVYCLWVVVGSEIALVQKAMLMLLVSIPIYPLFNRVSHGPNTQV